MEKEKNKRIYATLLLLFLCIGAAAVATMTYYRLEKERCFVRLNSYVEQAGSMIYNELENDRRHMKMTARILSHTDLEETKAVQELLAGMNDAGLISELSLLLPGDLLVGREGEPVNMTGKVSFEEAAGQDDHLYRGMQGEEILLYQCVAVKQDGKTAAVLLGRIDLERLPLAYCMEEYEEAAQFFLLESGSGQFLLDTWHQTLGKSYDLGNRKPAKGYSWDKVKKDLTERRAGYTVFRSRQAGENFYASYAPVPVEDWMIIVSVPESAVFAYAEGILSRFYLLVAFLLCLFVVYFFWTLRDMEREKQENERSLKNVTYIMDVEKYLFAANIRREHISSALERIAEYLTAKHTFFVRTDGGRIEGQNWWNSGEDRQEGTLVDFQECFPQLFSRLMENGFILNYHLASDLWDSPEEKRRLSDLHVRSIMAVPVKKPDGRLTGILGAVNMKQRWENAEPLSQVAMSFSLTVEQYESYQRLGQSSRTDALTGLLNRTGYNEALEALENTDCRSFACIYADVNGLHEINNRLGHQAGDEMLVRTARAFQEHFPEDGVYRIGGDEFVVLCQDRSAEDVNRRMELVRKEIGEYGYELAVGMEWRDTNLNILEIVDKAENLMRSDKQQYYAGEGQERQNRLLDERMAELISRKEDMDVFLSVLAPQFRGVYFVDLKRDAIRHLFIPPYFKKILKEKDGRFSQGLLLYASRLVKPEFYEQFEQLGDYEQLQKRLDEGETIRLLYQKTDGDWMKLQVMSLEERKNGKETLWIFTDTKRQMEEVREGGVMWPGGQNED